MNMKPLGQNVLIKKIKDPVKQSGWAVPETDNHELYRAEVLAVGSQANEEIQVGGIVVYEKFSGNPVGENILINDNDILGTYEQ